MRTELTSTRFLRLLQEEPRAFRKFFVDDYAEGMLCEEGRDSTDSRAECAERGRRRLVLKLFDAEGFGRAPQSPSQTVERQVTSGQSKPARLKISERVEYDTLGVNHVRSLLRVEEWRLIHGL